MWSCNNVRGFAWQRLNL